MNLPPDTLRRLLTDRAVGELSDDLATLLDAHIASDSAARAEAGELNALAKVVRQEMSACPSAELPAFPREAVESALRSATRVGAIGDRDQPGLFHKRPAQWLRPVAIAASVALAFYAGRHVAEPRVDLRREMPAAAQNSAGASAVEGMWTLSQIRRPEPDRSRPAAALRWTSPLSLPTVERS